MTDTLSTPDKRIFDIREPMCRRGLSMEKSVDGLSLRIVIRRPQQEIFPRPR